MENKNLRNFIISSSLLILFIAFTLLVRFIDLKPIGPQNSIVGFATINSKVCDLIGVNFILYTITDWASIFAIVTAFGFGVLGLCQLIKRKSISKVDSSILVLGGFYIIVFCTYLLFEYLIINYRPVLINGILEASYPSSTTMLVLCIMPTAMMQIHRLITNKCARSIINSLCSIFTISMVLGRILSGVHWFTDIVGGILISTSLVMFYYSVNQLIDTKKATR